jgi:hypothetical protein
MRSVLIGTYRYFVGTFRYFIGVFWYVAVFREVPVSQKVYKGMLSCTKERIEREAERERDSQSDETV